MSRAWISTVSEDDAQGRLKALYEMMVEPETGHVDHILMAQSHHPAGLDASFRLYRAVMGGTKGLPKAEREMIALLVSRINGCEY